MIAWLQQGKVRGIGGRHAAGKRDRVVPVMQRRQHGLQFLVIRRVAEARVDGKVGRVVCLECHRLFKGADQPVPDTEIAAGVLECRRVVARVFVVQVSSHGGLRG